MAFRSTYLRFENVGDVTVVNFLSKRILDKQQIQCIGEQLFSLVEELDITKILLNLKNVEYLSASALGKLIELNGKVKKINGRLAICNMSREIYQLF